MSEAIIDLDRLQAGFRFELEVTGITHVSGKTYPISEKIPLDDAIVEIVHSKIEIKKDGLKEVYNPSRPQWGLLPIFFEVVKKNLKDTKKVSPQTLKELRLYIAIGSKLDYFYGTDIFFTLREACVRIDISLIPKNKVFLVQLSDVADNFKKISNKVSEELVYQYKRNRDREVYRYNPGKDVR